MRTESSFTGALGAQQGMNAATAHADRNNARFYNELPWSKRALLALIEYAATAGPGIEFTSEDVRRYAYRMGGLPVPPDERAWGQILRTAMKQNIIAHAGFGRSRNPQAHCRPVANYVVPEIPRKSVTAKRIAAEKGWPVHEVKAVLTPVGDLLGLPKQSDSDTNEADDALLG